MVLRRNLDHREEPEKGVKDSKGEIERAVQTLEGQPGLFEQQSSQTMVRDFLTIHLF